MGETKRVERAKLSPPTQTFPPRWGGKAYSNYGDG